MSAEKIRSLVASLSTANNSQNEFVLKKIITEFMSEDPNGYAGEFILSGVSSKEIVKLLSLLENESPKIRKLSLLTLTFIIRDPCSKIYFLEKCGLGLGTGKIFLTRLKYLHVNVPQVDKATEIMRILLTTGVKRTLNVGNLFWYVPLPNTKNYPSAETSVGYCFYDQSIVLRDTNGDVITTSIPDPLTNICGVEASEKDFVEYESNYIHSSKKQLLISSIGRETKDLSMTDLSESGISSTNLIHLDTQKNLFVSSNGISIKNRTASDLDTKKAPKSFLKDKVVKQGIEKSGERLNTPRKPSATRPNTSITKKSSLTDHLKKDIKPDRYPVVHQSPLKVPGREIIRSC